MTCYQGASTGAVQRHRYGTLVSSCHGRFALNMLQFSTSGQRCMRISAARGKRLKCRHLG